MKVFIVRHGETDSNKLGRLMGQRIDASLNREGIRQANALAESLKNQHYDVIFTSPLKRALETAQIIALGRNLTVYPSDKIKERDYGSLSGKTWEEVEGATHSEPGAMRKNDLDQEYDYRPYGGESVADVKNRLSSFIQEVKDKYPDKQVLIVAHGGILRLAHFLFREEKIQHIKNASIEEFEV